MSTLLKRVLNSYYNIHNILTFLLVQSMFFIAETDIMDTMIFILFVLQVTHNT